MFFFLSKVLSFLIDPFFWIIVMFLISIFHYKKYLRRSFLIIGISMILFFSNSLIFNYVNDLWSVKNVNEKEHYQEWLFVFILQILFIQIINCFLVFLEILLFVIFD